MLSRLLPAAGLKKITVTSAAGAAAVLLAAGCGASPAAHTGASSLSPIQAITLAAHQAKAITSTSFTMDIQMTGATSGSMAGSMQIQLRPSLLLDEDLGTLIVNGHSVPGGVQEIANSQTIYMKMALLQQELGKPWLKISYAEMRQVTGLDLSQFVQQAQDYNPAMQTQMLAGAKDVKTVGTQSIGGVKTTEYTGTYTISAVLARLPSSFRNLVQKQARSMGFGSAQFKVWIDAQHQVRKMITAEHGTSTQITVTVQVTSTNQPVNVTYPPASEVATIPLGALQG